MENHKSSTDKTDETHAFQQFIEHHLGCSTEAPPDGLMHRFDDPEKRAGNNNCWAVLQPCGTRGSCGNWGTSEKFHWRSDSSIPLSEEEQEQTQRQIEENYLSRTTQRQEAHSKAAKEAASILSQAADPRPDHAYLIKKQISPANSRQYGENLLVPMQNTKGEIRNVQKIHPGGKKRFLKDGEVSGNFALIGADSVPTEGSIIVCEGFATAVTLNKIQGWPVAAAMSAGNLVEVCKRLRNALPADVRIIVAADDDRRTPGNPGLAHAYLASDMTGAGVMRPLFKCSECDCTDFNDLAHCPKAQDQVPEGPNASAIAEADGVIPLTTNLPQVRPLVEAMLPRGFVGFVTTTSERLQVPPDYLAVAAIAVAAGLLGGKVGIHPKQNDPWEVTPTMWAGLVGGPSTLKSACLTAAKQPLEEIEAELASQYATGKSTYEITVMLSDESQKDVKKKASKLYQTDPDKAVQMMTESSVTDSPPVLRRIVINDATVEKLGEIMGNNPNGLILIRDELSGWLAKLADEDHQSERAYYLECFEGQSPFTWDRIGRGTIRIVRCTLSIVGGIQPSKLAPIIQQALNGSTDDGLIQRFQLAVWPNVPNRWEWIDKPRDEAAYQNYCNALRSLHELPDFDSEHALDTLRFSKNAQVLFRTWMVTLQTDIRSDNEHPVMQSHLAKMPKTIAGLALLFELLDGGRIEVGEDATSRALLWADYLISHARRLYSVVAEREFDSAKMILSRRRGLPDIFTASDVQRKNWAGLTTKAAVSTALELLADHRYLTVIPVQSTRTGGRPTSRYRWHPDTSEKP